MDWTESYTCNFMGFCVIIFISGMLLLDMGARHVKKCKITLTNYVVINKTKYEVCISLKNHLLKSRHHHNTVNFSSFMMGKFSLKNELFLGLKELNIIHNTN